MTHRGSCAHSALVIGAILTGPQASAQPPRPADPPTYDCEPGRPDPVTKSCRCPDDYEPHVHENKIPYCRKLPKRTRAPRSLPAAAPSGLACGELAPRAGVACMRACRDVQRDAAPSPWNTDAVSWIPLNDGVPPTTRACSYGPTANARVDASCAREAGHLSVGITASASRAGDCGACTESSSVAAFDWRTRVPRRSRAALFVQARQTKGTAASKRCTLQVGEEIRSWGDVEVGIVRSLDERDLDLHLTCMDPNAGLVSAGCRGVDEPVALAIDLETGPLPPPSLAATGEYPGPPGFDRGMQTTQHCGNDPESWVRGSATLDTASGRLGVDLELETDSTAAGPKGRLSIDILGEGGKLLATVESTEVGIGGMEATYSGVSSFIYPSSIQLREYLAKRAVKLAIRAVCTGSIWQRHPFGHSRPDALTLRVK